MGFELTRFIGKIDEEFLCGICTNVLENPVQSKCEHIFCSRCINDWLAVNKSCPSDRTELEPENLKPVARYFRNLLDKLKIKCDYESRGCKGILKLEHLNDHINNRCKHNPNTEIVCDRNCNLKITRREYETKNCFQHLTSEFTKLNDKLNDKLDKHLKIVNTIRWQVCYNIDICVNEPNILEYGRHTTPGDIALVQSNRALAPDNPSFKIQILDLGSSNIVTFGLTRIGYPINYLPGWREGSIGFHGDDGKLYNARTAAVPSLFPLHSFPEGVNFGTIWQNNDVIECGIKFPTDFVNNGSSTVSVYFSRSEELVGSTSVKMPPFGFFPTIAMRSEGSKVKYIDSSRLSLRYT